MVHGGDEYHLHSNKFQEGFYESLIDMGVDAVIAHHPHVVEEVELYKKKPIFYSLGNFIFDQYFSKDVQQELSVKITVKNDSVNYQLIPLKSTRSQPRQMTEEETSDFLKVLADRSLPDIKALITQGSFTLPR
jgi:poly-gamma-glutamate synthesis protein (capsule biosynthesis protein)